MNFKIPDLTSRPIGLWDPRWGDVIDRDVRRAKRAYAVVQLRKEDKDGRLWNLVGFQTNLKWGTRSGCCV